VERAVEFGLPLSASLQGIPFLDPELAGVWYLLLFVQPRFLGPALWPCVLLWSGSSVSL
jgi:hypothetical protein